MTDLIALFLKSRTNLVTPARIEGLRFGLNMYDRWLKGRPSTTSNFLEYRAYKLKECKPSYVALLSCDINLFHKWAKEHGHLKHNPVPPEILRITLAPTEPKAFTETDYKRLLTACERSRPYWRPACIISWNTGMRISDVATLKWESVNFGTKALKFIPRKTQKAQVLVEIPMAQELEAALSDLTAEADETYVLPLMQQAYTVCRKQLVDEFQTIRDRAGVKGSFHSFRHGFMTRMVAKNVNPALIASCCGVGIARVLTYTRVGIETKRDALFGTTHKPVETITVEEPTVELSMDESGLVTQA